MAGLKESFDKAVSKLLKLGGKAADGAKDIYDKAKPGVDKAVDIVSDGAKDLYEKVKPGVEEVIDKVTDGAKELYNKVVPDAKDDTPDLKKELDAQVQERIRTIRGASFGTDLIHDFAEKNYAPNANDAAAADEPSADADESTANDKAEAETPLQDVANQAATAAEQAKNAAEELRSDLSAQINSIAEKAQDIFDSAAAPDLNEMAESVRQDAPDADDVKPEE